MLDAFDVPFMQRALFAGLVLAVPLGLVGTWVVLRALAFFSHAVGVGTFPGVVVGLGVPAVGPFLGAAAAAGILTAAVVGLERDERMQGGAVTGLVLSTAMALGAVLLTTAFGLSTPVEAVLFGSLLAITQADVVRCLAVALVAIVVVGIGARRMQSVAFDRRWSRPAGARPGLADLALLMLIAATVVVALPVVGSLLVSGLLILPAATARVLTAGVFTMLPLAAALSAVEIVVGLAVARELDAPPGSVICAVSGLGFAVAVLTDRLRRRSVST
ncbi:MAG: metal ABC transporter permease [Solirubrobacteraceae bacterium MAG38_C4-C5]|nr:metal ABC transporter permease [Candidatus Siliceabacter maunaloa]